MHTTREDQCPGGYPHAGAPAGPATAATAVRRPVPCRQVPRVSARPGSATVKSQHRRAMLTIHRHHEAGATRPAQSQPHQNTAGEATSAQPAPSTATACPPPKLPWCCRFLSAGGQEGTREDVKAKRRPADPHCPPPQSNGSPPGLRHPQPHVWPPPKRTTKINHWEVAQSRQAAGDPPPPNVCDITRAESATPK